ncbi:nucleoside monophosphate kinase [bacterium]|nr:nucleoside monophosphate kinase [bacterium]
MDFPIFKTKREGIKKHFDLTDPIQRKEYFQLKAGEDIEKIKRYLEKNSFIVYLLGKKNSGKGTYSKMFAEIVGSDKTAHISVGDVVRRVHEEILESSEKKAELINWLRENYRGYISIDESITALLNRDTKTLLPTEFILSLIEREISKMPKKSLFIDGFPRDLDQVSYSLFFRHLIDYRQDPDIFVLIDVPEAVINERIKWRRICPLCHTSRNLKLLPTSKVGYDKEKGEFYLICDNPECKGARMIQKEGDEAGIELIRDRLNKDQELINKAFSLHGVPKILLRNSVPVDKAEEFIDDYEITPEYSYELDGEKVKIIEKPWKFYDDNGTLSYSLMPPPVVLSLLSQMVEVLNL